MEPARDELVELDVDPRVEIGESLRRDQDLHVPVVDGLDWLFARIGQLTSHLHILQADGAAKFTPRNYSPYIRFERTGVNDRRNACINYPLYG